MNFFQFVFQDWHINKGNIKFRIFLVLFRVANFCSLKPWYKYLGLPYIILYKFLIQWIFTLEVPYNISIGRNFSIYHGQALILNYDVVIGANCTLRHCTTIGVKTLANGEESAAPIIGDNVDVGNNVSIIGNVCIGNNVKIGSGTVVIKDIESNCIAVGNPARQILMNRA